MRVLVTVEYKLASGICIGRIFRRIENLGANIIIRGDLEFSIKKKKTSHNYIEMYNKIQCEIYVNIFRE